MSASNAPARRMARYRAVIESASAMREFSLASLKLQVREEQPGFVTRMVKALEPCC